MNEYCSYCSTCLFFLGWLCCPTSGKHNQTAAKAYGFLNNEWRAAKTIHDRNVAENGIAS